MRLLALLLLLHAALLIALKPPLQAPPLQKIGKGKYAHWPLATHTSSGHKINIALSCDGSPARVKLKFFDGARRENRRGGSQLSGQRNELNGADHGSLPSHVLQKRSENGRDKPKIGFVLLENRDSCSHLLGMQVNEAYRGQGLAKVFVAIWLALCLCSGIAARSGRIDKPILAHILQGLGFTCHGGTEVLLTDAKRLRDCVTPSGFPVFAPKFSRGAPHTPGGDGGGRPVIAEDARRVFVRAEYEAPADEELWANVMAVLQGEEGDLELRATRAQLQAALDGSWRGFER